MVEKIKNAGGGAVAKQGDVTKYKQMEKAIAEVHELWGSIDILVNNAGAIVPPSEFIESNEAEWDMIIGVDFKGFLICSHICAKYMIKQNWGRIINIASDTARYGEYNQVAYSGCKGAIISSTKSLAKELVKYNILVNTISPGLFDTPMVRFAMTTPEGKRQIENATALIPMKRLGLPAEIGDAVVFFASDMSTYITGQVLSVNGGLVMP